MQRGSSETVPSMKIILVGIFATIGLETLPSLAQAPSLYEVVTVDQCYGQKIPVECDPGFMVRVLNAEHRQTIKCKEGFANERCTKEELGNPACVGNTTCVFKTPWVYLDSICGYSNNFQVVYQCIPTNIQNDVCQKEVIQGQTGYITTPNYPKMYPLAQKCTLRVEVHPLHHIRFYLLDLFLAYYNQNGETLCVDTVVITDPADSRRTEKLCAGNQRTVIFTTSTNKAILTFDSEETSARNAKGFWLYYEAFDPDTTSTTLVPSSSPSPTFPTRIVKSLELSKEDTSNMITPFPFLDRESTPWYQKYINMRDTAKNGDDNSDDDEPANVIEPSTTKGFHNVFTTMPHLPRIPPTTAITTTKLSFLVKEEMTARERTTLRHRIYGLVKEESNWAPKTIVYKSTTTPTIENGIGRPKISRGNHLKTKQYSRNLNDIDVGKITAKDTLASTKSEVNQSLSFTPGVKNGLSGTKTGPLAAQDVTIIDSLGKEYIAAISTGAGFLIILVGVICGLLINIKLKKQKGLRSPPPIMPTNMPPKEVILAYDAANRRSSQGVPNLGFQEVNTPKEVNGFSNPHFKDGSTPWMKLTGLLPIDEIPENLYTEVKQCDLSPEHVKAKAQYILGRSKSKSMDDIHAKQRRLSRRLDRSSDIQLSMVNPMSLSLDSLDCGSQVSYPSTVEVGEEDPGQEYYETIDDMYHDIALAHARASRQQFQERLDSLSLPSTPRSARSAGPNITTSRSPLMTGPIHTSHRANLLQHADVAL